MNLLTKPLFTPKLLLKSFYQKNCLQKNKIYFFHTFLDQIFSLPIYLLANDKNHFIDLRDLSVFAQFLISNFQ